MIKHFELTKVRSKNIKKPILVLVFLLFMDWLVFAVTFSLYNVFRPDILAISVYVSLYLYLFLTKRKDDIPYLAIASLLALAWMLFANNEYGYNREMLHIFKLNAYPIFAWSVGLSALYLVYSDIELILMKNGGWIKRFFLFSVLYLFFMISLETIAYHVFNIRNDATAIYKGLPICDCIHAPRWMQISYFLIGPVYFILCTYYNLKKKIWNLVLKN